MVAAPLTAKSPLSNSGVYIKIVHLFTLFHKTDLTFCHIHYSFIPVKFAINVKTKSVCPTTPCAIISNGKIAFDQKAWHNNRKNQ